MTLEHSAFLKLNFQKMILIADYKLKKFESKSLLNKSYYFISNESFKDIGEKASPDISTVPDRKNYTGTGTGMELGPDSSNSDVLGIRIKSFNNNFLK